VFRYCINIAESLIAMLSGLIFLVFAWAFILPLALLLLPVFIVLYIVRIIESHYLFWNSGCMPIRREDVLWLLSKPENQQIISGILQVDGYLDLCTFRNTIQQRVVCKANSKNHKMYSQVTRYIHSSLFNFYWKPVSNFDIKDHIYQTSEHPITDKKLLEDLVGHHVSKPFQAKKSPWEFLLIPYLNENGQRKTTVLFRIGHAMSDGSSLAYFLVNILADECPNKGIMVKKFSQKQRTILNIKGLWYLPLVYLRILLQPGDRNHIHSRELTTKKKVTWSKPIPLDVVKHTKNRLNATVNDVIIGCFSKAVHDYLRTYHVEDAKREDAIFSGIFAVDTRSSFEQAKVFRNHVAGVVMQLPVAKGNVHDTIMASKYRFDQLKKIGAPISIYVGWCVMSYLFPVCILKRFAYKIVNKTTASISNIIGPTQPLYLNGLLIDCITFWPPPTGNEAMGVSFCSYDDCVRMGLLVDSNSLTHPGELVALFEQNVFALKTLK